MLLYYTVPCYAILYYTVCTMLYNIIISPSGCKSRCRYQYLCARKEELGFILIYSNMVELYCKGWHASYHHLFYGGGGAGNSIFVLQKIILICLKTVKLYCKCGGGSYPDLSEGNGSDIIISVFQMLKWVVSLSAWRWWNLHQYLCTVKIVVGIIIICVKVVDLATIPR